MPFIIKYIENNMIKNNLEEWWAYYKIEPYNYSFLSPVQKGQYFYKISQLIGQTRKGNVHLLQLCVEENMRAAQERSKRLPVGSLRDVAIEKLDRVSEVLIDGVLFEEPKSSADTPFFVGESQLDYSFYIGFRLVPFDDNGLKNNLKETAMFWKDYFFGINNKFMGDYVTVSKEEFERYSRIENLTYSRISTLFKVSRLEPNEIGYIVEHLYGLRGVSLEEYNYNYSVQFDGESHKVDTYDILKLSNVQIEEFPKYLIYTSDTNQTYCTYLSYSEIVGEINYPGSEVLYYQQSRFDFPIDTSIKLEIIDNKKALSDVRKKKKDLNDMDNHAYQSGNEVSTHIVDAIDDANELEAYLQESKDVLYIMSYLVRVTADSKNELDRRVNSVRDFYDEYNIKLVCPSGDMMNFHNEFIPSSKRVNMIKRTMGSNFISGLGFGAAQYIGEKEGVPIGYVVSSLRFFYVKPWIAAQGVPGAITNSLSVAFIGSLGWGKSFCNNLLVYYSVLFGAKAVIIDPKSERGKWKKMMPYIANEINIINLSSDDFNRGMLDPFVTMSDVTDAENLALDILTFLMGISIRDSLKYPTLRRAIREVGKREKRGLLLVVDELRQIDTDVSNALAEHLEGFVDTGLAQLLFSDGEDVNSITFDKRLNIIQIADLILPDKAKKLEEYTPTEMLSVALMISVSTFCLNFIHSDNSVFKITNIDEAWSLLNISQGKVLANKLVREGRSMNAGVYFCTQNAKDLQDETIKNNIGMFFIFHSEDKDEIKNSLELLGLDSEDESNQQMITSLHSGECVMKDIYGRINVVKFEYLLPELYHAFDTSTKNKNGLEG